MDLGIAGRWAIVCASSQGLGRACADALAHEGVNVVINGRGAEKLEKAAAEIRALPGVEREVVPVVGDITTPEGRGALLAACPAPDILVTNNRGPTPGPLPEMDDDLFEEALTLHYRSPVALLRAVLPGMKERGWGRIVNITSAMVTTPREFMISSAGARAGLTAAMKAASFDAIAHGVTINNLLPERFATQRQVDNANRDVARRGIRFDEAWAEQAESIAAGRHGKPEELGATCAFVCSVHAAFMSGMNIHLDGGSYPGLV
jgi:3-oxoacyl-[acyl-carrier protein] reductase